MAAISGEGRAGGGNQRRDDFGRVLISLIEKKKSAPLIDNSVYSIVSENFEAISEARKYTNWSEIVRECGFEGLESRFRDAYSKERKRRAKKEKEVVPEKKKEVTQDQKHQGKRIVPPVSKAVTRASGQQIGQVTLTGKGRFQVNEETPLDEL
ncbi:MAG: hypothetical protein ACYCT9_04780 [Leptospirillum sp.]|jgi:hypothetical protein